jgi:hypothetical protein
MIISSAERWAPGSLDGSGVVVLKGRTRGGPLSVEGLDEILGNTRARAGLTHGTCHELRHTSFTRLREAGVAIEALQPALDPLCTGCGRNSHPSFATPCPMVRTPPSPTRALRAASWPDVQTAQRRGVTLP